MLKVSEDNFFDDKALLCTMVDLYNIPNYTTQVNIGGVNLTLDFQWNVRMKKRTLLITDSENNTYLRRTIINPNEPLNMNSFAKNNGLYYDVTLMQKVDGVADIFNWKDNYTLMFFQMVGLE